MSLTEAEIDALYTEIELLHKENNALKVMISKLEERVTVLEKPNLMSKDIIKRYKTPPSVSFMKNPEE